MQFVLHVADWLVLYSELFGDAAVRAAGITA
jgi:hypothetical protein